MAIGLLNSLAGHSEIPWKPQEDIESQVCDPVRISHAQQPSLSAWESGYLKVHG